MALFGLKEGIVVIRFDHEGIVADTGTGKYMAINRTAYEMIDALTMADSEEAAIERIQALMEVDAATVARDLAAFKDELVRLGLAA